MSASPKVEAEVRVPRVDLSSPPAWLGRLRGVHPVYIAIPVMLVGVVFAAWLFRLSSPQTTQIMMPDPAQPPAEQVVAEVWPGNPLEMTLPYPLTPAAQRLIGADPSSPCMTDATATCLLDFEASVAVHRELLALPPGFDVCALDLSWSQDGRATLHLDRAGPAESVPLVDCTAPAAAGGVPIPADGMIPAAPAAAIEFEGE